MSAASIATDPEMLRKVREAAHAAGWVLGRTGTRFETFPTGMTPDGAATLRAIVRAEGASRILETGLALGLSTLSMIESSCSIAPDSWMHVSIDPFQERDWDAAAIVLLRRAGIAPRAPEERRGFHWIAEDSTLALPAMVRGEGERFDLAFIDGGHTFDLVFADLFYASRLVKPGGLIVVDDLWMPAIRIAIDFFEKNLGLVREDLPREGKREFAFLRVPKRPASRAWDHFVSFGDPRAGGATR
jgi:predicted O-methyltransferase YrrM